MSSFPSHFISVLPRGKSDGPPLSRILVRLSKELSPLLGVLNVCVGYYMIMELMSLPAEVLKAILVEAVKCRTINRALRLRLVSRMFIL